MGVYLHRYRDMKARCVIIAAILTSLLGADAIPRRLESVVRAGRLYLSLIDCVALAMENKLDIAVQRYGARTNVSGSEARLGIHR